MQYIIIDFEMFGISIRIIQQIFSSNIYIFKSIWISVIEITFCFILSHIFMLCYFDPHLYLDSYKYRFGAPDNVRTMTSVRGGEYYQTLTATATYQMLIVVLISEIDT